MKFLHLILFIFIFNILSSQQFVNTNEHFKFEAGIHPAIGFISIKDRITYERDYLVIMSMKPFFGYFPFKNTNLSFGVRGEYSRIKSNLISLPSIYGAGIYSRFIIPKRLKHKFFKRLSLFAEINYNRQNYTLNDSTPFYKFDKIVFSFSKKENIFEYSNIGIPIGIIYNATDNLKFEVSQEYLMFFGGNHLFNPRISLTYMFNDFKRPIKHSKQKKEKKEKKKKDFKLFNDFIVGSSLTYIWNSNTIDYPVGENFYEEYTWNLNFATSINKRMIAGIQVLNIFTSGTDVKDENFLIYGLFSQFNFLPKKRTSLFGEISINRGDYCTCSHLDPYLKNNLWYVGFGVGFELPIKTISENLFLDLSFMNYQMLNKIKTKYNYTQYIVGLNYHFGK